MKPSEMDVINLLPDEIVVLDAKNQRIEMVNNAVCKNYNVKEADIIGRKCHEILHLGMKPSEACPFNATLATGKTKKTVKRFTGTKKIRFLSVETKPLRDTSGKIVKVVHISKDVTKKRLAEIALWENKERYRRLVVNAPLGILSCDIDGTILDANRIAVTILGFKTIKAARETNVLKQKEIVASGISSDIKDCINNGKATVAEKEYLRDSLKVYLRYFISPIKDEHGKTSGVEIILEDCTQRRLAENELQKMNKSLLTLSKTSSLLQLSTETDDILDTAIDTFQSIGFDRVRIYLMEGDKLVGKKSSHMDNLEMGKVVLSISDEFPKVTESMKYKKPVVINNPRTRYTRFLKKEDVKISASLPLIGMENIIGMISLDNKYSKKKIRKKDLNLLMTYANQIATAIENAKLYAENQKKIQTLSALYDVSSTLSGTLDLEKILNMIVIRIVKLLKADIASIMLQDQDELKCEIIYDIKDKVQKGLVEGICKEVSRQAMQTKRPFEIFDLSKEKAIDAEQLKNSGIVSMLVVPLIYEQNTRGVINIISRRQISIDTHERELLKSMSAQAAIIIENSKLYETIKEDKENLTGLLELSQKINSTLNLERLFELMLEKTIEMTHAEYGFLMLLEGNALNVRLSKGLTVKSTEKVRIKIGEGISGHVAKTGKPLIVGNVKEDDKYIKLVEGIRSTASIPLMKQNQVIGVLTLESRRPDNFKRFQKSLNILTNQIAIAVENAQLYDQIKHFNDRLKSEIDLATRELREKNIELKKMDQLKSDFVSNVSHELRTPLTSIAGYTKLMALEKLGPITDNQKASLDIVSEEAVRLTRLINNVLDLSKLESGKIKFRLEKINLVETAREAIQTLDNVARDKKIAIDISAPLRPIVFKASKDLVKQIFINLLNNAIKFTPSKGKIEISMKRVKDYARVNVKDNGKGISKEQIPKLFDKFYQVDSSMTRHFGGTGLGLVIVKHIVNAHKGRLRVRSKEGRGSEFIFELPIRK